MSTATTQAEEQSRWARAPWLQALVVLLLGTALYVPNFWKPALQREEARRAIPAREMLESGDFVIPTVWQRTYLRKPPLHFWTIALCTVATGEVNEVSTRLPSIASVILTALMVLAFGRRVLGPREAFFGALLTLVTFACLETGTFGEIDPYLIFWAFAATASLWLVKTGGPAMSVVCALALAGGLMTKGPPMYVFFGAAAIGAGLADRERWKSSLVPLILGTALASIWVVLVLGRQEASGATEVWSDQVALWDSESRYFAELLEQAQSVLAALLPGILAIALLWGTRVRAESWREPVVRFVTWTAFLALAFFIFFPGARPRYAYPVAPWFSVLAGVWLSRSLNYSAEVGVRRALTIFTTPFLIAGLLVLPVALWMRAHPGAELAPVGVGGLVLAALTTLAAGVGARALFQRRASLALAAALAVLSGARLIQLLEIVPAGADRYGRRAFAAELVAVLPEEATVRIDLPSHRNELFYLDRPLRWIDDLAELEDGDCLITGDPEASRSQLPEAFEFQVLLEREWGALLRARSRE